MVSAAAAMKSGSDKSGSLGGGADAVVVIGIAGGIALSGGCDEGLYLWRWWWWYFLAIYGGLHLKDTYLPQQMC